MPKLSNDTIFNDIECLLIHFIKCNTAAKQSHLLKKECCAILVE